MTPELETTLRRMTVAQVRAYKAMRKEQGDNVIARWHHAKQDAEQYPEWPQMQEAWRIAQDMRDIYEQGMTELDALIAEKEGQ